MKPPAVLVSLHRVILLAAGCGMLHAQSAVNEPAVLEYTGTPLVIPYTCSDDDLQWAGMICSDELCPIFLEISHVFGSEKLILLTGNLHSANATLYSILLRSQDGGRTWNEPTTRIRGAELDAIEFADAQNGWISGQILQPLPNSPFFLTTTDAGKTWQRVPLLEEGSPGAIRQFHFRTRGQGRAAVERAGEEMRWETYESQTGGSSWNLIEKSVKPPQFPATEESAWRVRAEPKLFRLEHREDTRWSPFASFQLAVAACREQPMTQSKEPATEAAPEAEGIKEFRIGPPAGNKGTKPKKHPQ